MRDQILGQTLRLLELNKGVERHSLMEDSLKRKAEKAPEGEQGAKRQATGTQPAVIVGPGPGATIARARAIIGAHAIIGALTTAADQVAQSAPKDKDQHVSQSALPLPSAAPKGKERLVIPARETLSSLPALFPPRLTPIPPYIPAHYQPPPSQPSQPVLPLPVPSPPPKDKDQPSAWPAARDSGGQLPKIGGLPSITSWFPQTWSGTKYVDSGFTYSSWERERYSEGTSPILFSNLNYDGFVRVSTSQSPTFTVPYSITGDGIYSSPVIGMFSTPRGYVTAAIRTRFIPWLEDTATDVPELIV